MRRLAVALAGVLLALLPAPGPALAQAEQLKLEVAGDGATGVTIRAGHSDGRPLETVVRLVLSAESGNGRKVGPLQLEPAGEGQGFYATGPVLSPGDWKVTVQAPAPYTGKATADIVAQAQQSPPPPVVASRDEAAGAGLSWWWWLAGIAALVALAALVAVRTRSVRNRGRT